MSIQNLKYWTFFNIRTSYFGNAIYTTHAYFVNVTLLNILIRISCFQITLRWITSTMQTTIFGILNFVSNNCFFENNKISTNNILLILKLYVYKSREKRFININNLMAEIWKVKIIEKDIALNNSKKIIAVTKTAPNR